MSTARRQRGQVYPRVDILSDHERLAWAPNIRQSGRGVDKLERASPGLSGARATAMPKMLRAPVEGEMARPLWVSGVDRGSFVLQRRELASHGKVDNRGTSR